jgi:hypothetical protein
VFKWDKQEKEEEKGEEEIWGNPKKSKKSKKSKNRYSP